MRSVFVYKHIISLFIELNADNNYTFLFSILRRVSVAVAQLGIFFSSDSL